MRLYLPQIIPFEVEKIVGRKFQIHRFNERKCQNWYVHINNTSCTWFVSGNQFRGVIFTKSQVLAIKLIRFVNAIKFCVAFWAVKGKKMSLFKEKLCYFTFSFFFENALDNLFEWDIFPIKEENFNHHQEWLRKIEQLIWISFWHFIFSCFYESTQSKWRRVVRNRQIDWKCCN